jgi:hypothetical protein
MMKLTTCKLNGKEYHLLLNGTALFDFYDRFGADKDMVELLTSEDYKTSFDTTIWLLAELSLQGELYRRSRGEDKGPIIPVRQAALEVLPADLPGLKLALTEAIRAGFVREHQGEEDYDPWLAELDQKKTQICSLARGISGCLQRFWASRRVTE